MNILYKEKEHETPDYSYFACNDNLFELIEEDTIEELDIDFLNGLDGFTLTEIERVCMEKQNEIIRKVNQLEKQIKELKE